MTNVYFNTPPIPSNITIPNFFDNGSENNSPFMVVTQDGSYEDDSESLIATPSSKTNVSETSSVSIESVEEGQGNAINNTHSVLSEDYWKFYFDVNAVDVIERLKVSFLPHKAELFRLFSSSKIDLYGPFWIVTTIVLLLFIVSNVAHWSANGKINFILLLLAANVIYSFALVVPVIYAGFICLAKKFFEQLTPSTAPAILFQFFPLLITFTCYFGYSLVCYIPLSLLFLPPAVLLSPGSPARSTLFGVFAVVPAGFASLIFYMNVRQLLTARLAGGSWALVGAKAAVFVFFFLLAVTVKVALF